MSNNALMAVSPIDGRYRKQVEDLSMYFSEYALIKYRVRVEIEYFIALCELPLEQLKSFNSADFPKLRAIYENFSCEDAQKVKEIEKVTNHDVKAVEYFIKDEFKKLGIEKYGEFVHFGLTSQDINNTSVPLSLLEGIRDTYMPALGEVVGILEGFAKEWENVPMLAHTHGQPASPTRLGKEIYVYVARLKEQLRLLEQVPYSAKFGGATGNFNAHNFAYPGIDWNKFAVSFVEGKLGLKRSYPTTQIEHYDNLAALFHNLERINTILIDLARDMWTYISMEYFRQ
ncbi:MAG: adenylosuccinate lyase, partial [Bacteroidales bacterium]|nr:adenylosuccinate lyase [Bacteroidales bacterium]